MLDNNQGHGRRLGWWAVFANWWGEAPVFYAAKEDGTLKELGTPEYIVFDCLKFP